MSGGGSRHTTTTQSSEPWEGQKWWLQHVYNTAGGLPLQQVYPGQLTADMNPEMQQGWMAQAALGRNNPLTNVGSAHAVHTLQNKYMGGEGVDKLRSIASGAMGAGSQQFQDALQAAWNRARPNVQSTFAGAGRFGGGLARAAEAREFGDIFSGMLNQDLNRQLQAAQGIQGAYQDERMNQMRALGLAPNVQGMGYTDAQQLLASGYGQNQFHQDAINREVARWNQLQLSPYNHLAAMSSAIQGGFPGGTQTINEPYYGPSRGQTIGTLAGIGLGAMVPGVGPFLGGSAGGILGGLF